MTVIIGLVVNYCAIDIIFVLNPLLVMKCVTIVCTCSFINVTDSNLSVFYDNILYIFLYICINGRRCLQVYIERKAVLH